ncbi:MAG: 2-aminoethylphosphonate--pyruvate transaminase [Candidatus Competibacteraceae bacterium]
MSAIELPENPYLLLTPGPLTTTPSVKATLLRDWCTWDDDYNAIVQDIRRQLIELATDSTDYTCVLMQGSGTFSVESCIGTAIPENGKLLVLVNGAYGERIAQIARYLKLPLVVHDSGELDSPDEIALQNTLETDPAITHVAMVHCETTTGILNPVDRIGAIIKEFGKIFIVDAMSSFGGIPMDMADIGADFLISSANKCIQGVPGFGFILAQRDNMEQTAGQARSLSLDMYEQWLAMEQGGGKWRFTSPTHVVRAFAQALKELDEEGGIMARYQRYYDNHRLLVDGMQDLGFECLLSSKKQSPIITSFLNPQHPDYAFKRFYKALKQRGFVIYPGKVTAADTFRIGNIGDIWRADIERLLSAVQASMYWC